MWHAWLPMRAGHIPVSAFSGLWLATIALGILLVQLGVGLALRYTRGHTRRTLLQAHFLCMLAVVASDCCAHL